MSASALRQPRRHRQKRWAGAVEELEPRRPAGDRPAVRRCLGTDCGESFLSEGFGNRFCPRCKTRRNTLG